MSSASPMLSYSIHTLDQSHGSPSMQFNVVCSICCSTWMTMASFWFVVCGGCVCARVLSFGFGKSLGNSRDTGVVLGIVLGVVLCCVACFVVLVVYEVFFSVLFQVFVTCLLVYLVLTLVLLSVGRANGRARAQTGRWTGRREGCGDVELISIFIVRCSARGVNIFVTTGGLGSNQESKQWY